MASPTYEAGPVRKAANYYKLQLSHHVSICFLWICVLWALKITQALSSSQRQCHFWHRWAFHFHAASHSPNGPGPIKTQIYKLFYPQVPAFCQTSTYDNVLSMWFAQQTLLDFGVVAWFWVKLEQWTNMNQHGPWQAWFPATAPFRTTFVNLP